MARRVKTLPKPSRIEDLTTRVIALEAQVFHPTSTLAPANASGLRDTSAAVAASSAAASRPLNAPSPLAPILSLTEPPRRKARKKIGRAKK